MKDQKLEIITKLFENKFNKENFSEFVSKVLNVTIKNKKESVAIWTEYYNYIKSYQIFGDYVDKNNNEIYIIAVEIKNGKNPTRAKAKQRDIIAKMLKEYRKDCALVAFYNREQNHWRIAFIKLEYSFSEKGIEEKITPSKRLSYIVGKEESCHTVKKQFMLFSELTNEITSENIETIFELEKVTNEFFDDYKKKYLDLKEYLESNEEFIKEARKQKFEEIEAFSEGFAKKLMGQLAFLYFLQKKGWLGVKIVPNEILSEDFNKVKDRAIGDERDILLKSFARVEEDKYKLLPNVMEMDAKESNILANAFKNYPKFDEMWGNGSKRFIRTLFERHLEIKEHTKNNKTFFNDYLEYLFYEALNLERGSNQYFSRFNCKIPFLNGGLFEPYDNYDWKTTDFKIPDSIFSNKENTGILDIFDRYNFTISENEPFETEVAVDPEMLGKVFENLLDVKDRKSKGAFYTPREIVHYMCKESLSNFLLNEIEGINKDDIELLIQLGEFTKEYDQHIFEKEYFEKISIEIDNFNEKNWGMSKIIRKNAREIDIILKNIRIADPATGSGAFPLGMLTEIVKARNILTQYIIIEEALEIKQLDKKKYRILKDKLYNSRNLYKLKLETIENSIYGVDIEPSAIEIAKLRLWLSIVVDTQNNNIRPLPNLDFNFMVGNSLLEEFDGISLFDENLLKNNFKKVSTEQKYKEQNHKLKDIDKYQRELFNGIESLKIDIMGELKKLHKAFFKEKNAETKKQIKIEIEKTEWFLIEETLKASGNNDRIKELEKYKSQKRKPYFLWKLEFAKVFKEKGGFDIVIGNPPYIGEAKGKSVFVPVQNSKLGEKYYTGKMDFWYFFTSLGIELLREKGILNYIAPNNWLTTTGGKKMRNHLMEECIIKQFLNFKNYMVFKHAMQQTMICLLEKNQKRKIMDIDYREVLVKKLTTDELDRFLNKKNDNKFKYYTSKIEREKYIKNSSIQFLNKKIKIILNKMKSDKFQNLKKEELINGIHPHHAKITKKMVELNPNFKVGEGIFVISEQELKDLNLLPEEKKKVKLHYDSSSIKRYYYNDKKNDYLIYTTSEYKDKNKMEKFPNLKRHLDKYKKVITSDNKPYGLHRARKESFFIKEKIAVLRKSSGKPVFSYIGKESYLLAEFYIIKTDRFNYKILLGILNSKLIAFWLKNMGKMQGENYQLDKGPLMEIPIKLIPKETEEEFIKIVDKIIELGKQEKDTKILESKVDNIIYKLYKLTPDEIELVEKYMS